MPRGRKPAAGRGKSSAAATSSNKAAARTPTYSRTVSSPSSSPLSAEPSPAEAEAEGQGQDELFDLNLLNDIGEDGEGSTLDLPDLEAQAPQLGLEISPEEEEGGMDLDLDEEDAEDLFGRGDEEDEGMVTAEENITGATDEGEEEDDDEDEEEEEDDDEEEDEDGEEDEDEGGEEEEDEEEEEGADQEDSQEGLENATCPESLAFRYPAAVPDFNTLDDREKAFKVARFVACQHPSCSCAGLQPPVDHDITLVSREDIDTGDLEDMEVPEGVEEEEVDRFRTEDGWWRLCGVCGHGWEAAGRGHVFAADVNEGERRRRGKVVGRIEEMLQDDDLLTMFPTPEPESITSLLLQLNHFVRPSGKKPATAIPSSLLEGLSPGGSNTPLPFTPIDTPGEDEEEVDDRPRKRRRSGDDLDGESPDDDALRTTPPAAGGKKPGGKVAGKGTKPRTVVRGQRGLVPMETDADGNQHPGGDIPESAKPGGGAGANENGDEGDEDVPLAKRPELDDKEKRRRELVKERAKEREDDVMRGLAKGTAVEESMEGVRREGGPAADVEVWEGVELPKLPLRPAAIEQEKREIILPVVTSREPNPVASILLIGLKNLFQKQLPKMPREYITRLVLDKNHISMAIVKRGWKVVGGICYRPFESRGFAEIVFCAVDSSEQIKGYGSHLMNSLKDHVRAAHPTINYFLTYADNYAVGYFRKQGFTKEISYDRERWVGYIKDYEGGTIMQCKMLPKVKYMEVHQMLADQKAAILAKIRTISKSHIVHPGLEVFKNRKPGQEIKLTKDDVPGLAESGWNPELDEIIRQPARNPHHSLLQLVLNDLQNEPSAWPFLKPVDGQVVHDYYEVISEPMDLQTMEFKLESNHYANVDEFITDAQLIFDNCRRYNGEKSTYTVQANKLEKALDRIMKKRRLP